jgi:hypothetical protein
VPPKHFAHLRTYICSCAIIVKFRTNPPPLLFVIACNTNTGMKQTGLVVTLAWLALGKCSVRISARTPVILTDLVEFHSPSRQISTLIRPRPLPPKWFPIHHSLIILQFDAVDQYFKFWKHLKMTHKEKLTLKLSVCTLSKHFNTVFFQEHTAYVCEHSHPHVFGS